VPSQLLLLAQSEPVKRKVGLHGDDFTNHALALTGLFLLGLAILAVVLASGRRRRKGDRADRVE
jgi:hypothetical protein